MKLNEDELFSKLVDIVSVPQAGLLLLKLLGYWPGMNTSVMFQSRKRDYCY
ncbi:hypothetical protein [Planktothrix paucivesiculata]|uniref:hypothetical protein n=1 Tax=Planktothrix paucivesiculata TaxID=1678308 RepID=UPI0038B29C7D